MKSQKQRNGKWSNNNNDCPLAGSGCSISSVFIQSDKVSFDLLVRVSVLKFCINSNGPEQHLFSTMKITAMFLRASMAELVLNLLPGHEAITNQLWLNFMRKVRDKSHIFLGPKDRNFNRKAHQKQIASIKVDLRVMLKSMRI